MDDGHFMLEGHPVGADEVWEGEGDGIELGRITATATEGVRQWRIKSVGRRPSDWLRRDFLGGSLLRDPRNRAFHKKWKNPPPWINEDVAHLSPKVQQWARQWLVLHQFHRGWIRSVFDRKCHYLDPVMPHRLWCCRPTGVEVEWLGPAPGDWTRPGKWPSRYQCRQARLCLWCLTRKVVRLHAALEAGPLGAAKAGSKHLVLARCVIKDPFIPHDKAWIKSVMAPFMGECGYDPQYAWWNDDGQINFHRCLQPDRVAYVRRQLGVKLIERAREAGVEGGILTFQVGPHLHYPEGGKTGGSRCFQYELCLLGEAPGPLAGSTWIVTPSEQAQDRYLVHWCSMPAGDGRALRTLLVGTSVSASHTKLGLFVAPPLLKERYGFGVAGAISIQPLWMMDHIQTASYLTVTRGVPLYEAWGTWHGAFRLRGGGDEDRPDPLAYDPDAGPERQRRALAMASRARHDETQARREALLTLARPLWPGLLANRERRRGRPALREPLMRLLRDHGVEVGANDLDWLVTRLGKETVAGKPTSSDDRSTGAATGPVTAPW